MTLDEAAEILSKMVRESLPGERSVQPILFGIKYHREIEHLSKAEIARRASDVSDNYEVQLNHGQALAKYVTLRDDSDTAILVTTHVFDSNPDAF